MARSSHNKFILKEGVITGLIYLAGLPLAEVWTGSKAWFAFLSFIVPVVYIVFRLIRLTKGVPEKKLGFDRAFRLSFLSLSLGSALCFGMVTAANSVYTKWLKTEKVSKPEIANKIGMGADSLGRQSNAQRINNDSLRLGLEQTFGLPNDEFESDFKIHFGPRNDGSVPFALNLFFSMTFMAIPNAMACLLLAIFFKRGADDAEPTTDR